MLPTPHLPVTLTLLTLTTLATGAPSIPSAGTRTTPPQQPSFTGAGRIRTRWNAGDHADLGCLTGAGLWTADEALCGTFAGAEVSPAGGGNNNNGNNSVRVFTLGTAAGPCRIYGARFECGVGAAGLFGIWPFPNAIPGVDCLRYGQYGVMASSGRNPPLATDPPQEIHFVTYSEVGKYVWLTWEPLES